MQSTKMSTWGFMSTKGQGHSLTLVQFNQIQYFILHHTKSGGVLCYTLWKFWVSVHPSVHPSDHPSALHFRCNGLSWPPGQLDPRGSRYPGVSWPSGGKISLIWYLARRYANRGILTPSRKFKVLNQAEKHFQYYVRWGWRYCGLVILTPT